MDRTRSTQGYEKFIQNFSRKLQNKRQLGKVMWEYNVKMNLIQWIPEALSLGLKRPAVKLITHLHLLSSLKNEWSCVSTPLSRSSWRDVN